MTEEERQARELLSRKAYAVETMFQIPYFTELWDEFERVAINTCINADPLDHETRAAYAAEARAIRKFRSKLNRVLVEAKAVRSVPA